MILWVQKFQSFVVNGNKTKQGLITLSSLMEAACHLVKASLEMQLSRRMMGILEDYLYLFVA